MYSHRTAHLPGLLGLLHLLHLLLVLGLGSGAVLRAQPGPRALLPDGCVVVAETADLGAAVRELTSALGPWPEDLPEVLRARMATGLGIARLWLGADFDELGTALGGGGAALGLLPAAGRPLPLMVLRPGDCARAEELLARFPEHVHFAAEGGWLFASATPEGLELLRARLPAIADGAVSAASAPEGTPGTVHVRADLAALRPHVAALRAEALERLDGPGRFLFAPFAAALTAASTAALAVRGDGPRQHLRFELQLDATVLGSRWEGLLAAGGPRPQIAAPDGTLAALALDRGLARLLADPGRFLDEAGVLAVRSFLSVADQLDGAQTSFADDLVGGLREPVTAFLLPSWPAGPDESGEPGDPDAHAPALPLPALALPALALVAPLADPAAEATLLRTAQVIALIANNERGGRGRPLFVLRGLHGGDGRGLCATPAPWRGPGRPPIEYGLSPTLAFGHGRAVLATTRAAAAAVLARLAGGAGAPLAGDLLELRGAGIAAQLERMRAPLELARQLDEGATAGEASEFLDALIAVARALHRVRLSVVPGEKGTRVLLQVERR